MPPDDEETSETTTESSAEETTTETTTESTASITIPDFQSMRSTLPEDIRGHKAFDDIKTFEEMAKQHVGAQKFIGGDRIPKPGEKSTPEEWDAFYGAMGRPEKAADYDLGDFAPPEGLPWDAEMQTSLLEDAHGLGITNTQANGLLRALAARQGDQLTGFQAKLAEGIAEADTALHTKWGDSYDANVDLARRALAATFGDSADEIAGLAMMDGKKFGDNPNVLLGFADLGQKMSEHELLGGGARGGPGMTAEIALQQIAVLEGNEENRKILASRSHPEHKVLSAKRNQLYKTAYPEGT